MIRRVIQADQNQVFCPTALQSKYFHLCCVLQVSAYTAPRRPELLTEKAQKLKDFELTLADAMSKRIQVPGPQAEA